MKNRVFLLDQSERENPDSPTVFSAAHQNHLLFRTVVAKFSLLECSRYMYFEEKKNKQSQEGF